MKRIARGLSALLLSVLTVFSLLAPVHAEGEDFDGFLKSEWIQMLERDYMSFHLSVKDYRAMGMTKAEVTFGEAGYDHYAQLVSNAKKSLELLHGYDYESLTDVQKHDYLVYERDLEDTIGRYSYPDYIEVFNPYTGDLSDYKTWLTEYLFYEKEDIEDYLTMADDFMRYFDDALEFTKEQAAKGCFMLDTVLDAALEEIDDFTAKKEDNPLIVIFEQNIDAFEGLTDEERASYKERNRDIVFNEIIPGHEKIRTELEALRGKRSAQTSVYFYPNGKEYFSALARYKTSSDLSCEEMLEYLSKALKESMAKYGELVSKDPTKIIPPTVTGYTGPEDILDHLRNNLQNFPEGPEVNYTPSYLDQSVANPSVMAYYLVCPIDDIKYNVIRINGNLTGDSMTLLYSTLTHEGFAGHLYQFTYYLNTNPNPIRHDISIMGYQEGWAQYAVRDLMRKSGLDEMSALSVYLNNYIGYMMQAAVDIAVNGLGYDQAKLSQWSNDLDLSFGDEALQTLYDAVLKMPGSILPYGYGQMKFLEYRERMISSLGDAYDELDFNRQLLENGPRPFEVVERDLEQYCESKGTTFTKDFTFFASEEVVVDENSPGVKLMKYLPYILIGIVLAAFLILFLIIRLIVRLFRKKKNRNKNKTMENNETEIVQKEGTTDE